VVRPIKKGTRFLFGINPVEKLMDGVNPAAMLGIHLIRNVDPASI
jgi:hypothetical protein